MNGPGAPERLGAAIARRWLATTALILLLVGPILPFAIGVPLDNSLRVWVVDDKEKIQAYDRFLTTFGSDERILLVVRGLTPKERPDPSLLRYVRDLVKALENQEKFPQVEEVVSIVRLVPDEVTVLLDEGLGGWAELPRLRKKVVESPLNQRFALLDLERDRATISVGLGLGTPDDRRALLAALEPFRERAAKEGRELLRAGQPFVNMALDDGAREVETKFLPLLVGVSVVAMFALTRSARITVLVLIPVGLCVLFTAGLVGVTGRSFNLILVITKPLIFVLALATGLHVAQSFQEGLREGKDRARAAARAFAEKALPCLFTTITTLLGFVSLATADVRPIREMGLFAGGGMVAVYLLTVVLLVALLAGLGPTKPVDRGQDVFGALSERLVRATCARRPRAFVMAAAGFLLCGLGGLAYTGLAVDTNAVNYLPRRAPVRAEYEAIEGEGFGLFSAELVVRAKDGSSIGASTSALAAVLDFEKVAAARPGVTAVLSFADALVDASWRSTGSHDLPHASIVKDALETRRVRDAAKKLLGDGDGSAARAMRVVVLAKTIDSAALLALLRDLEGELRRIGGPAGLEGSFTGGFPLMLGTQLSLVSTLASSLSGAAITIAVSVLILVRSLRRTLLAAPPNALAILGNFGLMRLAGMPLDVGTVMTSSIVLGIAVDNAVHYLFHYGRARDRGQVVLEACATGAREAGRSLVVATGITVAGFATLLLSSFAPTWRFGALAAFGLVVALAGAILFLPALVVLFERDEART